MKVGEKSPLLMMLLTQKPRLVHDVWPHGQVALEGHRFEVCGPSYIRACIRQIPVCS